MKTTLATVHKHGNKTIDAGFNTDSRGNREPVFYYFGSQLPEQYCDELNSSIGHTGWHTNSDGVTCKDGSGEARGIVVALPAMPGFPDGRFMAGYVWGDNDERVLWPEVYADSSDAARMADNHAERFADMQREDNEKWETARTLEIDIEDALTRLRECLALRHRQCMTYVRDEITELCETIRDKRETLAADYAQYI